MDMVETYWNLLNKHKQSWMDALIKGRRSFFLLLALLMVIKGLFSGFVIVEITSRFFGAIVSRQEQEIQKYALLFFLLLAGYAVLEWIWQRLTFRYRRQTQVALEDELLKTIQSFRYPQAATGKDKCFAVIRKNLSEFVENGMNVLCSLPLKLLTIVITCIYGLTLQPAMMLVLMLVSVLLLLLSGHKVQSIDMLTEKYQKSANRVYLFIWDYINNLKIVRFLSESALKQ